tara:strand:+ start:179 stop:1144 length:966 start_codon:yes stop_codon:yes gene_type:complete
MELFDLKNNTLGEVELKPFKLEKEIQELVEKNTETLFQLEFIRSEFTVSNYRIDSLCYDVESNSFVIIEYKKGSSYSVIDQGFTYLQLLLNNKSDFLLTLSQHYNKVLRLEDIDWSQSKIIFISQSFNSYQKDSVNFKNLPFELWEIKRFSNNTIVFNKHLSSSKESIDSLSNSKNKNIITSVNKEIKVKGEDEHLSKCSKDVLDQWSLLKDKVSEFVDVEVVSKNNYINWVYMGKNLCYFIFRKNSIVLEMVRGTVFPNGTTSKNYFNIDDPKGISNEGSWEWKSGNKGTIYKVQINKTIDIDYVMFLIKQKYNNLKSPS